MRLKSSAYANMAHQMMDKWFQLDHVASTKDFFNLACDFDLSGIYYNRNTFAEEPFIERYPLAIRIKQERPLSEIKQVVTSERMLNINFSYGLFCNV